jgi:LacI family transcriptional regulator
VPEDVAMVGIDGPPWSDLIAPALTTLGQPTQQMAKRAFELLIDRVTGSRNAARFEVFQFQLRIRESCGSGKEYPRLARQASDEPGSGR